jgi:hypothetical protein
MVCPAAALGLAFAAGVFFRTCAVRLSGSWMGRLIALIISFLEGLFLLFIEVNWRDCRE